jgi:hypothetical protein
VATGSVADGGADVARHCYALSGLCLESDLPFATLGDAISPAQPERSVRLRPLGGRPAAPADWLVVYATGGDAAPGLSVGHTDAGYLLRYHDLADFVIDPARADIAYWREAACTTPEFEHLLADHVLAHYVHLRGQPSFHGSAVACAGDTVVGFLGPSRSGKSTLAASLGEPFGIVCDDCLVVSIEAAEVRAFPSYPFIRLGPDSARALGRTAPDGQSGKLRVPMPLGAGRLVLRCLYLLEPGDTPPEIAPLSRRDAIVELARNPYRIDPEDRGRLEREFDLMVEVVRRVRVARLRYRHRYEDLPAVRNLLLADVLG